VPWAPCFRDGRKFLRRLLGQKIASVTTQRGLAQPVEAGVMTGRLAVLIPLIVAVGAELAA
jgi:hypothetical protein